MTGAVGKETSDTHGSYAGWFEAYVKKTVEWALVISDGSCL